MSSMFDISPELVGTPVAEIREHYSGLERAIFDAFVAKPEEFKEILEKGRSILSKSKSIDSKIDTLTANLKDAQVELSKAQTALESEESEEKNASRKREILMLVKETHEFFAEWKKLKTSAPPNGFLTSNLNSFVKRFADVEKRVEALPRLSGKKTGIHREMSIELRSIRSALVLHIENVLSSAVVFGDDGSVRCELVKYGGEGAVISGGSAVCAGLDALDVFSDEHSRIFLSSLSAKLASLIPAVLSDKKSMVLSGDAPSGDSKKSKQKPKAGAASMNFVECPPPKKTSDHVSQNLINYFQFVTQIIADGNISRASSLLSPLSEKIFDEIYKILIANGAPTQLENLDSFLKETQTSILKIEKNLTDIGLRDLISNGPRHPLFKLDMPKICTCVLSNLRSKYLCGLRDIVDEMWNENKGSQTESAASNFILDFSPCSISNFPKKIFDLVDEIISEEKKCLALHFESLAIDLAALAKNILLFLPELINQKHKKVLASDNTKCCVLHNDLMFLSLKLTTLPLRFQFYSEEIKMNISFAEPALKLKIFAREVFDGQIATQIEMVNSLCRKWANNFIEFSNDESSDEMNEITVREAIVVAKSLAESWQSVLSEELCVESIKKIVASAFDSVTQAVLGLEEISDERVPTLQNILTIVSELSKIKYKGAKIDIPNLTKFLLLSDLLELNLQDISDMYRDGTLSDYTPSELAALVNARFEDLREGKEEFLETLIGDL